MPVTALNQLKTPTATSSSAYDNLNRLTQRTYLEFLPQFDVKLVDSFILNRCCCHWSRPTVAGGQRYSAAITPRRGPRR